MIKLSSTQKKVLEIYNNEGHIKAWNYWKLMQQSRCIFLGEVPSSEFIDGESLAKHIGLTKGVICNNDTPWLKFILDGNIVFVPMKPLMHSVSWQSIYQAGAVYGSDDYGDEPLEPYTKQNANVTIGNDTYRIMLINTTEVVMGDKFTYDAIDEWNQLFIPIMEKPNMIDDNVLVYFEYWNGYTEEDLLMDVNYGLGSFNWVRNSTIMPNRSEQRRCVRSGGGVLNQFRFKPTSNYRGRGWRPLLRLMDHG